ncbi:MAG: NAD(P)-dependent oxidoreductase [Flavobacterium sp.]|uniref:SDR family oxidoreductase n=1 Tax=Flavobacterium sp. TaxID=239 RepID=UPI000C69FA08|nr:SDR family oxidoreductase [Flavobacterium sp.]MBF04257.1 NAD(P)-dependent oxidoreductase [Flavobacterium sp.]|tara:strand:- start:26 stop:871 length:846 start_codon:yes stop_codon:yes gene_type:complete
MTKQISLLGCGWLGLPLANDLLKNGFSVKGSTTSAHKLELLQEKGIQPFIIALYENTIEGDITGFLKDSEVLVIDIPPDLRSSTSASFVAKIQTLVTQIEKSEIKKVLFVSSTSVYEDVEIFSTPLEVTEETPTNPETESGKQLVEVEQLLLDNPHFQTIVLRFGGLIGEDRHPIKYLAGRENIENPDGPINFIHQEDCIGIILEILKQLLDSARSDNKTDKIIFNAVAPQHPTREEYYHKKAKNMNLPLPIFAKSTASKGKIINSAKIETVLSYIFKKEV